MRAWIWRGCFLIIVACLTTAASSGPPAATHEAGRQEVPVKKPASDYMSKWLSLNTQPLGLKEDAALRSLWKQSRIKWAIRAGSKYILD